MWFQKKKKFLDGIKTCNKLNEEEFDDTLKNIYEIYLECIEDNLTIEKYQEILVGSSEISDKERDSIIKALVFIVQRFHMFILSPVKMQSDLINELGFSSIHAHILLKLYSDINRKMIISDLDMTASASENVIWDVKTTLSEPTSQKCRIPKASITLKNMTQEMNLKSLNHSELSRLFDKLETIQCELDNLNKS